MTRFSYPYGVPMSFVYAEGKLYFHSAVEGHKLDAIAKEDKCSFTIIDQDEIHPDKYTSYFRSVIAFGRIQRLESMEELIHGLRLLGEKYNPGDHAGLQHEIDKSVAMPGGIPDDGWDWPLWKWKGIIINESDCVYGKFFNGKAGFISRSWWTHFCNWRRSLYPMPENGR